MVQETVEDVRSNEACSAYNDNAPVGCYQCFSAIANNKGYRVPYQLKELSHHQPTKQYRPESSFRIQLA